MDNFFATTSDDALVQAGQLHSYLLPGGDTKISWQSFLSSLTRFEYLAPQPREALHLTVTRFRQANTDDLSAAIAQLSQADELTNLPVLRGRWQSPKCENSSVIMRCELPGFTALCEASERAAARILGESVVCYPRPYTSHLTLAYGVGDGDDKPIMQALEQVTPPRGKDGFGEETFTSLAWCMVKQNRAAGTYTFQVLGRTEFKY